MISSINRIGPLLAMTIVLAAAVVPVDGDVVISMPPPKKVAPSASQAPRATGPASAARAAAPVHAGKLALARYSRARTGTYDTYFTSSRRAGYRIYSTPILYEYPYAWGWSWLHFHGRSCR